MSDFVDFLRKRLPFGIALHLPIPIAVAATREPHFQTRNVRRMHNATFKVDPRLASLLGENYRSTELAIKELIDNAYDADATEAQVILPEPLTNDPIIIRDNGTGMTEGEVRHEYLNIASSRMSRKGERTRLKNRLVKGRKGIGKFAGLMVASLMEIRTRVRGKETYLRIWRDELIKAKDDLEQVKLPMEVSDCDPALHGTEIILSGINQNFTFPNAERLRRLLVLEYGRSEDFQILVGEERVDIEDIPGDNFESDLPLQSGEVARIRYTIAQTRAALKQSGIAFRVGGKIVGQPQYFGLDEEDLVPQKLLRRIYGEIEADALEADVTADWGSIIDNSVVLNEIRRKVRPLLEHSCEQIYQRELTESRTRLQRRINGSLDRLPEFRRGQAQRMLDKVIRKFYGESESKLVSVVSLLLESFEQGEYWTLKDSLSQASTAHNGHLDAVTDAFAEFGMVDLALMAQQTSHRVQVLRDLEQLIFNPETSLEQVRKALAGNLWVLGSQYSMITTNQNLHDVVQLYVGHKFTNGHAQDAPTLLLLQDFNRGMILLDLKPADHPIDLHDRRMALEYKQNLKTYLPGRDLDVIVLGGALSPGMADQRRNSEVHFRSYKGLLTDARVQLNWLLGELQKQ